MNRNTNNMSDDVLVKYLLGEATGEEQSSVAQWLAADAANKKYYEQLRLIWDESKHLAAKSTVNEQEAWERFMQRVQSKDEAGTTEQPVSRTIPLQRMAWMKVAAVLVLLAGAGWLMYTMAGAGNEQIVAQSNGNTLVQTLPDGSVVTLNKNSSLSYPSKFDGSSRKVTLKGEGFFSITPNKAKPFIIDAENTSVTVVGTTFNVKCGAEKTEVIVETGIVQVQKMQHVIKVLPHQKAIVAKNSETPVMEENTDELYNYYRTREFVCHGTPLWKLVSVLNEAYNAKIVIGDKALNELKLETTFHDEPLDNILKIIGATFDIKIEKNGSEIILNK